MHTNGREEEATTADLRGRTQNRYDPRITQITQISVSGKIAPVTDASRSANDKLVNLLTVADLKRNLRNLCNLRMNRVSAWLSPDLRFVARM